MRSPSPLAPLILAICALALPGFAQTIEDDILTHPASSYDQYGSTLAIKRGLMLVGSTDNGPVSQGDVHGYLKTGSGWQMITTPDPVNPHRDWGITIDISIFESVSGAEIWAAVGNFGFREVEIWEYRISGAAWEYRQTITQPTPSQRFGRALAMDGRVLAIADPLHFGNGPLGGAVWAYRFNPSTRTWDLQQELTHNLPAGGFLEFGFSLDVVDLGVREAILVGAPRANGNTGAIVPYSYLPNAGAWMQLTTLTGSAAAERLGTSVAWDISPAGVQVIAAAPQSNSSAGLVEIFHASSWQNVMTLTDPNGQAGDQFGHSIDAHDGKVIIGAVQARGGPNGQTDDAGCAFVIDTLTFNIDDRLVGSNGLADQNLGNSVRITGGFAVVGAPGPSGIPGQPTAPWSPGVYIYQR